MSSDLDSVDTSQHIKLGDVEGAVAIEFVRELDHIEIEPAALALASSGCTELMTDILDALTNLVVKPSREGTSADSGRVCLHYTDGRLNGLRRDTKASANATDGGV